MHIKELSQMCDFQLPYFPPFFTYSGLLILFCFPFFIILFAGILRYKVDFQSFQLDDEESEYFDLDDY